MSLPSTLFIAGNPHASSSTFIAAIQPALCSQGIDWVALAEEVSDGAFDVPAFQVAMSRAEVIILHFPLYWYSPPALVKHWMDSILTSGWAFPGHTSKLRGKSFVISVTTGAPLSSFQPDGTNGSTLEALLLPMERTARYCGMEWGGIVASQWNSNSPDTDVITSRANRHADELINRISVRA